MNRSNESLEASFTRFWASSLLSASCHTCDHSRTFFHPHKNSRTSFITLKTDTHFSNCSRKALHTPLPVSAKRRFLSHLCVVQNENHVLKHFDEASALKCTVNEWHPDTKGYGAWFGRDKELKLCFVSFGLLNSRLFFITQRFWQNIFIILPLFRNIFIISENIQTVVVIFVVFNKRSADLFFELVWST